MTEGQGYDSQIHIVPTLLEISFHFLGPSKTLVLNKSFAYFAPSAVKKPCTSKHTKSAKLL